MRLHSPWIHALILFAVALPYFINLGASSIWDASEAFYAETPREMLESGDYLAPHFNYAPRTQKPPLVYWIVAASYKVFGVSEFALRLPGALAACGILLFCYGIGRSLFNPRAALFAAIMAGTTARIFILARRLPIDIFLILFLTGTLFFLVRALRGGGTRGWVLAYLFAALGFLTKGPVAVLIPAGACALWMLRARRPKLSGIRLLPGAAVFAAVTLPWYLLVFFRHGWAYIAPFFLSDNLGRFASQDFGPSRGILYYFGVAAADFFPWSILAPGALVFLWRRRARLHPLMSLDYGLPLFWCIVTFVFFSLSKNKQEYYIAPLYPVAAVWIAGVLENILPRFAPGAGESPAPAAPPSAGWFWAFGVQAAALFAFAPLTFYLIRLFAPDLPPLLHAVPSLIVAAGLLFLAAGIVRKDPLRCLSFLMGVLWVLYLTCAALYLPAIEKYRPVKEFCRMIETQLDAGAEAGYFRTALPSMAFYLRRPIFEESSAPGMRRRLESGNRVFCILSRKALDELAADRAPRLHILARRPRLSVRLHALGNARHSRDEELLLISNRPGPETDPGGERATS